MPLPDGQSAIHFTNAGVAGDGIASLLPDASSG
jgi:hypothetical protein